MKELEKNFAERMASATFNARPGQFVFADGEGLVSDKFNAGTICSGLVGCRYDCDEVGKRGLLIVPEVVKRCWSDSSYYFDCTNMDDGLENCRKLWAIAQQKGIRLPALEYCYGYEGNGIKAGEGFQGAAHQLVDISENKKYLNSNLTLIGGDAWEGWMVSSSEYYSNLVWLVYAGNGNVTTYFKYKVYRVRCIVAF